MYKLFAYILYKICIDILVQDCYNILINKQQITKKHLDNSIDFILWIWYNQAMGGIGIWTMKQEQCSTQS